VMMIWDEVSTSNRGMEGVFLDNGVAGHENRNSPHCT
jgi:hypothetical protein